MKMLHASVSIELPEEMFEAAQQTVKFSPLWQSLTKGLDAAGIKYKAQVDTSETRARPTGARRGRKPKDRLPTLDEVRGILAPEAAE